MKIPQIVVMQESGEVVYEGSLLKFCRDNGDVSVCSDLRDGMMESPPEVATIGGGAAPMFFVSLAGAA